jgi:hypothetical protein
VSLRENSGLELLNKTGKVKIWGICIEMNEICILIWTYNFNNWQWNAIVWTLTVYQRLIY